MVVAAVDHRDVDGLAAEESECEQPAEAASDDDDCDGAGVGASSVIDYSPGLECMMPPSAKTVVAVR